MVAPYLEYARGETYAHGQAGEWGGQEIQLSWRSFCFLGSPVLFYCRSSFVFGRFFPPDPILRTWPGGLAFGANTFFPIDRETLPTVLSIDRKLIPE